MTTVASIDKTDLDATDLATKKRLGFGASVGVLQGCYPRGEKLQYNPINHVDPH